MLVETSDFGRQKQKGSTATDYNAEDDNDKNRRVIMEVDPLREALEKRNWIRIVLTHDDFPFHCALQTW